MKNINRKASPPIIIIGMHRSGTSLLSRMLQKLGLFMGIKKDPNNEALFFKNLNEWLLRQSGGAWDHPDPIRHLLDNTKVRFLASDYMSHMMKTPRVTSYMGWGKYLRYRSPANMDISWGWKDPRNTYTLPLWLDLFPDAKVIHIFRHGVDVANSLKMSQKRLLPGAQSRHHRRKLLYWLRPKRGEFAGSLLCSSMDNCFSLWEKYLLEARMHVNHLEGQAIEVKYEDLLVQPCQTLKSLALFCSLSVNDSDISKLANHVNKSRAYAYQKNPELQSFAGRMVSRLGAMGY